MTSLERKRLGALLIAPLLFVAISGYFPPLVLAKKSPKRADGISAGDWYSIEKEKEIGTRMAATVDGYSPMLQDKTIDFYLNHLAEPLAAYAKGQFPITIHVVDSNDVFAETIPGGHQYVARGMLLRVQNECELTSVLARGIAHSALRSATRLQTRADLIRIMATPVVFNSQQPLVITTRDSNPFFDSSFRRQLELAADYLALRYLYDAGYDPKCYKSFVVSLWPPQSETREFSAFPRTRNRLVAIDKEISKNLPEKTGAILSTAEFESFTKHLLSLEPPTAREPQFVASPSLRSHP